MFSVSLMRMLAVLICATDAPVARSAAKDNSLSTFFPWCRSRR